MVVTLWLPSPSFIQSNRKKLSSILFQPSQIISRSSNHFNLHLSWQVGGHDRLGMQLVPLKLLTPYEPKELVLDLLKNTDINDLQNKKPRGTLVVELMFTPLREESMKYLENSTSDVKSEGGSIAQPENRISSEAGVLSVTIQGAHDVEGEKHNNPYAVIHFRGERKKTKVDFWIL